MFFFAGVRAANRMIRSAVGCLCCFICGGPIMFIIGIVILVSKNTREDDIKAYNDAVALYLGTESVVDGWTPAAVNTVNTLYAATESDADYIEGSQEGITTVGESRVLVADSVPASTSFAFAFAGASSFTLSGVTTDTTKTVTLSCSDSDGCMSSTMESQCKSKYGVDATYNGGGCVSSGSCGTCSYTTYLQEVCVVVTATSPYVRDTTKPSCFYPFASSSHLYDTTATSSVRVMVRKSDDPYLVLQRVTEGDNNFGITKEDQQRIGVVLLVIGLALLFCAGLACFGVYFCLLKPLLNPAGVVPMGPGMVGAPGMMPVTTTTVVVQPGMPGAGPYSPNGYNNNMGGSPMGPYPPQQQPPMNPNYGQEMQPMGPYPQQQPPQYAQGVPLQQPYGAPPPQQYGAPPPQQYSAPPPQQQFAQGVPPQGPGEYVPAPGAAAGGYPQQPQQQQYGYAKEF